MSPCWQDGVENSRWPEVLHLFTVVNNLYLSEEFSSRTAPALQELVMGGTTEAWLTTYSLFWVQAKHLDLS